MTGISEPTAFLRLSPERWIVGCGDAEWSSNRPAGAAFYAPDFFLEDSRPWLSFERIMIWTDEQWRQQDVRPVHRRLNWQQPTPFFDRIHQLLILIEAGHLQKAVPVEFAVALAAPEENFHWALPTAEHLFPYGFRVGNEAMWGATPEIFLKKTGRDVETMALAGTAPHGIDLLENPKERHEHQLVIDDIRDRLQPFGPVDIGETSERKLPGLKHLCTPIHMNLEHDIPIERLVEALHPTAALGGFPREPAWKWLKTQPEAGVRRRFGAPFGYVDADFAVLVVAIRNVQMHSGRFWLGSGCGVVQGSVPEKEWDELQLKRDTVCSMLGLT